MKTFLSSCCLIFFAGNPLLYASNGLDAYRQGNFEKAGEWLSAEKNLSPLGTYYLGQMRLYGYGQLKNKALALEYYTKSANQGVLAAQQYLARYYLNKEQNPEKALIWFKKAADQGDIEAQLYCAGAYLFGVGTSKNLGLADRYLISAAKAGDGLAQFALAENFLNGRSAQNKKVGLVWLRKAAEKNHPAALVKLSQLLREGKWVPLDTNQAKTLLDSAAQQNYTPALRVLAAQALAEHQEALAEKWLLEAALKKDSEAQASLADLYLNVKGPFYQPDKGMMWMLQAAHAGSERAQNFLSQLKPGDKPGIQQKNIAEVWTQNAKNQNTLKTAIAKNQLLAWLSNGQATSYETTAYRLNGIDETWNNPLVRQDNRYNTAPQIPTLKRTELYQPAFTMINPNDIGMDEYYTLLASSLKTQTTGITFPHYPFQDKENKLAEAKAARITVDASNTTNASNTTSNENTALQTETPLKERTNEGNSSSEKPSASTSSAFTPSAWMQTLYNRAILGDVNAQFQLGQIFHYGLGVEKNKERAITLYERAAEQGDLRAQYQSGALYLENHPSLEEARMGLHWIADAAFKGNAYAQYVLAQIHEQGWQDDSGTIKIPVNLETSHSFYYLSAANGYGPAEYRLAELLVAEESGSLDVRVKQNKMALIERLYADAARQGVSEAYLPLAFYQSMNRGNPKEQAQALSLAEKAAESGDPRAALLLGLLYDRGIGTAPDPQKALSWYERASNPATDFILGTYYAQGKGLRPDEEKSRQLLDAAAQQAFSYAYLNLAVLKQQKGNGENFVEDLEKARDLRNSRAGLLLADYLLANSNDSGQLEKAEQLYQDFAEKGDKTAQLKLAYLYDKGIGISSDPLLAEKWYLSAAEQGEPQAQYLLAQRYQNGLTNGAPDYAAAKKWYQAAAQSNYIPAWVALGYLEETVFLNENKAFNAYEKAASAGNPQGIFNLALMHEYGKNRPVDYQNAIQLYKNLNALEYPQVLTQLGGIYGRYASSNQVAAQESLQYYQKAAELGDRRALYHLGRCYQDGLGVAKNPATAAQYYEKAAAKGDEKANFALAELYQQGAGIPLDLQKANTLYSQLAQNHHPDAQYQLALRALKDNPSATELAFIENLLKEAASHGNLKANEALPWVSAQKSNQSYISALPLSSPSLLAEQTRPFFNLFLQHFEEREENFSRSFINEMFSEEAASRKSFSPPFMIEDKSVKKS